MTQIAQNIAALPVDRRAELLARLRSARGAAPDRIVSHGPLPEAPLTFPQRTLWFVEQLATGNATYHLPHYFRVRGPLDPAALRRAMAIVVSRHHVLRTAIVERDEGPVQVVAGTVPVDIPVMDMGDGGRPDRLEEALRRATAEVSVPPFALDHAPLWRARLYRLGPDDHLFVFVVHHIIFDGASIDLLCDELSVAYRAETIGVPSALPEVGVQYTDYALWQRDRLTPERVEQLGSYWRNQLAGVPPLPLPASRPRPPEIRYVGAITEQPVRDGVGAAVQRFARSVNTTTFVVYLAGLWALLHRICGADDIVVGTSTSGRQRTELDHTMGFFVNVVALRGRLSPRMTFRQTVMEAERVLRDALAHSELPWEHVVRVARPERDLSRSPIFQVTLVTTSGASDGRLGDLPLEPLNRGHGTSRFDLAWGVSGTDAVNVAVEYNTDLFDEPVVKAILADYAQLMFEALMRPDEPLSALLSSSSTLSTMPAATTRG